MNDLQLLCKYEQIAFHTKGEAFFPIAVDNYLKEFSLLLTDPQGQNRLLVPKGQVVEICRNSAANQVLI